MRKLCIVCGQLRSLKEFNRNSEMPDGRHDKCHDCSRGVSPKVIIKYISAKGEMKVCAKCKTPKHISEFHKDKSRIDGLQNNCKDCKSDLDHKTYLKKQFCSDN